MASPLAPRKVSPELLQALHRIKSARLYSRGATLFQQGSASAGVYLVLSGEVRLLLTGGSREDQLLQVMGPGTMLGLSESMTGERHRMRGETAIERRSASFHARSSGGFCWSTKNSACRW